MVKTKALPQNREIVKAVRQRFFYEFSEYHCEWLRRLVKEYKKHGSFPVFPTQIIEYYPRVADKEIAIFSTLCMSWRNGRELEQIASMRKLMGDSPSEWLMNREFVTLSIGREQDHAIEGYTNGRYWKIAKVFDLLYDTLSDVRGLRYPSSVFTPKKFSEFCQEVSQICDISGIEYKQAVIELVLRTSDGIGRNLWPTAPSKVKCPVSVDLKRYMTKWFPFWRSGLWSWSEAIKLFRLENEYDFFYAWLAHTELERLDPLACRKYATRYQSRIDLQRTFIMTDWKKDRGMQPEINFNITENGKETETNG